MTVQGPCHVTIMDVPNFSRMYPPYLHCAINELNLVLSHAFRVTEIVNMVSAVKSVGVFFKYSTKRQRQLEENIVGLNERIGFSNQSEIEKDH